MKWTKLKKDTPSHKDLVLLKTKDGAVLPAIYYNNQSFKGFYPFTTFYRSVYEKCEAYKEVRTEKIKNVVEWMLIPE